MYIFELAVKQTPRSLVGGWCSEFKYKPENFPEHQLRKELNKVFLI